MTELEALARAALAEAARGDELDDRARTAFIDAATPAAWLDLSAKNKALAERVAGLEEGLKPFADVADAFSDREDDEFEVWRDCHEPTVRAMTRHSNFRRARTLITGADHAKG